MPAQHGEGPTQIIIRHLSGSRAQHQENFPVEGLTEITLGRDPSSQIRLDANFDDLVSRRHAKVTKGPETPPLFTLTDLGSSNGTFVNGARLSGPRALSAGDVIQLGAGGPELVFDLHPRPAMAAGMTRIATGAPAQAVPALGVDPSYGPGAWSPEAGSSAAGGSEAGGSGGAGSRTALTVAAVAALLLAVAAFAYFFTQGGGELPTRPELEPNEIARDHRDKVVLVQYSWRLIHTGTGSRVNHMYLPISTLSRDFRNLPQSISRLEYVPLFLDVGDANGPPVLRPALSRQEEMPLLYDSAGDRRRRTAVGDPVGGSGSGSGFVVGTDGFIATARHVAAPWRTRFDFRSDQGLLVSWDSAQGHYHLVQDKAGQPVVVSSPDWTPAPAGPSMGMPGIDGEFDGRNDTLAVVFAGNTLPVPASRARESDEHDVALIKIDLPEPLAKVELGMESADVRPGDPVVVLGYPGISAPITRRIFSQDAFNRAPLLRNKAEPTVSVGNIGRVISANDGELSELGNVFQLTLNSGSGTSGGPVFDKDGRVIAIYYARRWNPDESMVSFAVPARYIRQLMSAYAVEDP